MFIRVDENAIVQSDLFFVSTKIFGSICIYAHICTYIEQAFTFNLTLKMKLVRLQITKIIFDFCII